MVLETMPNKETTEAEKKPESKIWVVFLVVFLILAAVSALIYYHILSKDWRDRYLTYENSRFGYSIEYPLEWTLGSAPINNDGRDISSPDGEIFCNVFGFANSILSESGEPQTLDEYIDWIAETNGVTFSKREEIKIDGEEGILIQYESMDNWTRAIYTLNEEGGVGFWCNYEDEELLSSQSDIFSHMVDSVRLNSSEEYGFGYDSCETLLSGTVAPLKDLQTLFDEDYTGVTMIERESWDQELLPEGVIDLEGEGYYCLPTPVEFDNEDLKGVYSEPMVTRVEWKCELEYGDYKYLESDSEKLEDYQNSGYVCEQKRCKEENKSDSIVYLCTK